MDLGLASTVKETKETDSLGGKLVLNSSIYKGIINLCYIDKSPKGAINVNIHFKTEAGDVIRETVYISNQAGGFTYKDKNTGEDVPLPGYSQMNSFFKAVTGKGIAEQSKEEKTIKVWDNDAKAEVPAQRLVFMDVHNKPIAAGILKISEEKTTKESNYKQGTGEFFDKNEFSKWFDADTGLTTVEKAAGVTNPEFFNDWKTKNEGKVITRKAKIPAAQGATAGSPASSAAVAPTTSLFPS
jgi:hypothetical protein